jgi:hypothetical protein
MRPSTPAAALPFTAGDYADLNLALDLRCRCCASRQIPFRYLIAESPHLADTPLGRIVPRLRCQGASKEKPSRVALMDMAGSASAASYQTKPWELVLVGE